MAKFFYRLMTLKDCEKLNEINASQFIGKAWREVDGKRQLVTIDYQDPTWPNGYDAHFEALKRTVAEKGIALGAFDANNQLIAFSTIDKVSSKESVEYAHLDQLFVSLEMRRSGIGKKLFFESIKVAKDWDMLTVLICAGSAEDTVAFYRALGCVDADLQYINIHDSDPRDLNLEYHLV